VSIAIRYALEVDHIKYDIIHFQVSWRGGSFWNYEKVHAS